MWERDYFLAHHLLATTLTNALDRREKFESASPWVEKPRNDLDLFAQAPRCEYVLFVQIRPSKLPDTDLRRIEDELRFPKGAPLPSIPPLRASAVIFSPDCGFALESKGPPEYSPQEGNHLEGPKLEAYQRLARSGTFAFTVALCAQIFLLLRQMKDTPTPSTKSRISFYTIATLAMGDGFAWISFLVIAAFVEAVYITAMSAAFFAFVSISLFSMKYLMDIWVAQAPERIERSRFNATATAQSRPSSGARDRSPGLPLPATARRTGDTEANPVVLPPDQDVDAAQVEDDAQTQTGTGIGSTRRELGAVYVRFCFTMLTIIMLSAYAATWPTALRTFYIRVLSFSYLSFWVPQIYRNVMRNCRKALRWEFVLGQSVLRLAPFIYAFTFSQNVFFIKVEWTLVYALTGWIWIQIWALITQEILGPRFFVRSTWVPPAYDYHPILREDDEEAGASYLLASRRLQRSLRPRRPNLKKAKSVGSESLTAPYACMTLKYPWYLLAATARTSG